MVAVRPEGRSLSGPNPAGPNADGVTFVLPDPDGRLDGVRLVQDARIPGDRLAFARHDGVWTLHLPRPDVDRMEYRLELTHPSGGREEICDPGNPLRSPGAFGNKSLLQFAKYREPRWLGTSPGGTRTELRMRSRRLDATVTGTLWSPTDLGERTPAPLLVVHDGPESDLLTEATGHAAAMIAEGTWPALRVALLEPGERDRWYAADPAYARALAEDVLPALGPTTHRVGVGVGVGASLGALALLHAHRCFPALFDGLFLQSGSFFHPEHDAHEARFPRYGPISRFVVDLEGAAADPRPIPVVLTVGRIEENHPNNLRMADTLTGLGYDVAVHEFADGHNYTAWRDTLDPHLTRLLAGALQRATAA